jgi:predicted glycosyltransferase
MQPKPPLLFHCQHSMGMGHLVRAFQLVEALTEDFHVVFLNGGRFPGNTDSPRAVEVVDLPALGMDASGALVSLDARYSTEEAQRLRRAAVLDTFRRLSPGVVIAEMFPFGRKKFSGELLPLLEEARGRTPAPVILCSLRDILVSSRHDQQHHDERAAQCINRYFDAVLVHADPAFARLEETFRPSTGLRKPVIYTGFVAPRASSAGAAREPRVMVSAGGGIAGKALIETALAAQRLLWPAQAIPMTLVCGPFLPQADQASLRRIAHDTPGAQLLSTLPELRSHLARASASVSQCGYNTAMDILSSGVPALVVPYSEGMENEQSNRARRLAQLGLLKVLEPAALTGPRLARELAALQGFTPAVTALNLDGAATTAREVRALHRARTES